MYRSKLWTMRMFAGFGTADDTNWRFRQILQAGGDGLSTAFDMPTLMGLDSDDPLSDGEVGRCGVAVDTLADMEDLYRGIDLGAITTSMTINSPAAVILAMYVAQAEMAGTPRARLGGTLQNDILKEYQAQKEFVFPPRPSMRLVRDVIAFTAAEMPRWHSISISGYHIREAGSTAAQELAFTLANGFAYVEQALAAGLAVDVFAPRLSFFFNAHIDFFEEIAKYRAARRIWARWLRDRYGAQSRAVDADAVPHPDRGRVAHRAAARGEHRAHRDRGARGRARRHPEPAHELDGRSAGAADASGRPASRCAPSRCSRTRPTSRMSPTRSAGSYFVEALTDEMERQAEAIFAHIDALGEGSMLEGAIRGIEENWFQGEIAESAYRLERKFNQGRRIVVGVNRFTEGNDEALDDLLEITNDDEERQIKRLAAVKHSRDEARRRRGPRPPGRRGRRSPTSTSCRPSSTPSRPTPPSARSWTPSPTSSAATSRSRRSEARPGTTSSSASTACATSSSTSVCASRRKQDLRPSVSRRASTSGSREAGWTDDRLVTTAAHSGLVVDEIEALRLDGTRRNEDVMWRMADMFGASHVHVLGPYAGDMRRGG